jgi:hypothetical protein
MCTCIIKHRIEYTPKKHRIEYCVWIIITCKRMLDVMCCVLCWVECVYLCLNPKKGEKHIAYV